MDLLRNRLVIQSNDEEDSSVSMCSMYWISGWKDEHSSRQFQSCNYVGGMKADIITLYIARWVERGWSTWDPVRRCILIGKDKIAIAIDLEKVRCFCK